MSAGKAEVRVNRARRIAVAAGLLAGVSLAATTACAQALRADDDPFARVGVTAGEPLRNGQRVRAQRPEAATPGPLRARTGRRPPLRGVDAASPQPGDPQLVDAPRQPRPRLQNFRSLERPPNVTAIDPTPAAT